MENKGDTIKLDLPGRPGTVLPGETFVLVTDYIDKTVSLIQIIPGSAADFKVIVLEVQHYNKPGVR